ncbi:Ppx/GppA phosphatase family protein [Teredinibacter haidensis]|uniref:Ppx/GppA phosphatase family protein n=1 Tax=Teredinibacter haidensis TaxID=2731755 RepID=UPI000948EE30|nr:Ppx/GppA phosphatase family protein [Teredinibacter haidensis]
MPQFESPYFAAIDLGSNSFHMLVVRFTDSRIEIIDREKEMVQIARGLRNTGNLDDEAKERALACLNRFSERLQEIPRAQVRAVGTKTLRSARNAKSFIKAAEKALGVPIQIISGYEEARLVYNGLSHTVVDEQVNRLVIDIGGGSTEFIIGKAYDTFCMESLSLGCVTYTENFKLSADKFSGKAIHKAYVNACEKLEEIRKTYMQQGWQIAYGTSGTIRAIAELLDGENGGAVIHRSALDELISKAIEAKTLDTPGIAKLRREVLPAGLAILQAIFHQLQLDKIHIADATLKEGLIYDNIGRFSNHDSRVLTVNQLQEKYRIDNPQAEAVSKTALHLWRQIENDTELSGVSRTKILDWAAKLHEIGLSISHSSHHMHGYYLLRHSDLAGFSRHEQYIMANLVRFHRKKITASRFEDMGHEAFEAFRPLLLCLRIATLLHRRRELAPILPEIERKSDKYKLHLDKQWLENYPLSRASLEQEILFLGKIGIELSFE